MNFDFVTEEVSVKDGCSTVAYIVYDDDNHQYVLEDNIESRLTADQLRDITCKLDELNNGR